MSRWGAAALLLLAACGGRSAEREADAAYAARRFPEAYAGYARIAPEGGAQVWAKAAAAAAAAGLLDSAAGAYVRLAAADPLRRPEALEGLERTGRLAIRASSRQALRTVVLAIRELAPERPIGRLAFPLLRETTLAATEAVGLYPAALAAAPDPDVFDSLLLDWGGALESGGDCAGAAQAYRAFLRRNPRSADGAGVRERLAACAYVVGVAALDSQRAMEAERWLQIAAADAGSPVGRRALLALGDARLAQGDPIAAAIVWQRAFRGVPRDSIGREAARRIRALGVTDTVGDSARMEDE